VALDADPLMLAATLYDPTMLLAVTAVAAMPAESVVAVGTPLTNVALGPDVGTVNVTSTSGTGLLNWSLTAACNGLAKLPEMIALWGVPPATLTVVAGPWIFARLKDAGAIPATFAPTT
jgi:hypothetical protein